MHRDLSYIGSKVAAPIELNGRTVKQSPTKTPSTQGKWDNLLNKTTDKVKSPQAVVNRCQDNKNAKRTLNPELNTDEYKLKTRKITKKPSNAFDPGNLLHLLKKSGAVETVQKTKKIFVERQQSEEYFNITPHQKGVKATEKKKISEKKKAEYASQITTLSNPNPKEDKIESKTERAARSPSANGQKKQYFLRSAIPGLSCGEETRREFHDRDELKIMQSANHPKMAKHLATTFYDQPLQPQTTRARRDPNRMNYTSYEDDNRLHPYTKGKKVDYPQYTERNTSAVLRPDTSIAYSPKYGGMEPLDALWNGRRSIRPQAVVNNIINPPEAKATQRASTAFSFRTYASKIF